MASDKRNAGAARPVRFKNPMVLMVNLVLVSIVILFIGITYGYLAKLGSSWLVFRLPKIFWLSTLSILLVSFLLQRLMAAYDAEQERIRKAEEERIRKAEEARRASELDFPLEIHTIGIQGGVISKKDA